MAGKQQKQGGKNAKFGRHGRNPSSKLQAVRSARNKAKRIARAVKLYGKASIGHTCPRHPSRELIRLNPIPMPNQGARVSLPCYDAHVLGVLVQRSSNEKVAREALRQSMLPREHLSLSLVNPLGHREEILL